MGSKRQEALDHIKNAEKNLKTGILKWRPDYDLAADEYNKAATCYKTVKAYQECKGCLLKAVECYKKNQSLFSAAKALDQCIIICKEMDDLKEIGSLAERACTMYQHHGAPDSGAMCLEKAAKIIEKQYPAQALELYKRGVDVVLSDDRVRQATEFASKVSRLLVRLKKFDEAADAIRNEIGLYQQTDNIPAVGRSVVSLVLVQLAREDYVAAEKAFREWGNCCEREEVQTLELLLRGYDEEDPDVARKALSSPFIKHMDVDYAKLAREIRLPAGISQPRGSEVNENAAPTYHSLGGGDEDDTGGGLC